MTNQEIREQTATVRLYDNPVKVWWHNRRTDECAITGGTRREFERMHLEPGWVIDYEERPYIEYRLNGEVKQIGTRQFRKECGRSAELKVYDVGTWDGVRYWRNGARPFAPVGMFTTDSTTKPADLRRVLTAINGQCKRAAEVRIIKF